MENQWELGTSLQSVDLKVSLPPLPRSHFNILGQVTSLLNQLCFCTCAHLGEARAWRAELWFGLAEVTLPGERLGTVQTCYLGFICKIPILQTRMREEE